MNSADMCRAEKEEPGHNAAAKQRLIEAIIALHPKRRDDRPDMEQAYVKVIIDCDECDGSGQDWDDRSQDCAECNGFGTVVVHLESLDRSEEHE